MLAPLDYTRPDGSALTLALRRYRAEEEPRLGTLFVNPGGPGLSGMEMAGALKKEGLRQFDVVGWDPAWGRRVHAGQVRPCQLHRLLFGQTAAPDSPAEEAALIRSARKFGASCLARSGALLEHVSTEETVRDLDLLRHVLGDPQLSYYGESYGSAIGSLYATMYPQRVGKLAFDGAYNFDDPPVRGTTYAFERQLAALVDFCLQGTSCSLGDHRDVALRRIDELLRSLDQAPMPAGDREAHPRRRGLGAQVRAVRTPVQLGSADQGAGQQRRAARRNSTARARRPLHRVNPDGSHRWTAYFAVTCLDERAAGLDERLADAAEKPAQRRSSAPTLDSLSSAPLAGPQPSPPTHWREHQANPDCQYHRRPGNVLRVSNPADQRLKNSVLLTMQGHGHGAYRHSNCIQNHVVAFLIHGSTPATGTSCDI